MTVTEIPSAGSDLAPNTGGKLAGQVALVTGGTRGIGAAICRSLACQGAELAAGYAGNAAKAEAFLAGMAEEYPGRHVTAHQGDIGTADDCRRMVEEVVEQHGRLDILVNNAGITADRQVLRMPDEDWCRVLNVNLSGAFFLCKAALEHMLERGSGRIVNISSIIGETGNIGQANYAASKSGLFGLTKTLAKEAAFALRRSGKLDPDGLNVTVNAVTPGFIDTDMLASVPQKVLDGICAQVPLGRLGRPDEVARVVHFLAAGASSYITGQVWAVNGGLDM